jgi:hypothetical protein
MRSEGDRKKIEQLHTDGGLDAGVVLLPESSNEDGTGIYDDAVISLYKALRAAASRSHGRKSQRSDHMKPDARPSKSYGEPSLAFR